MGFLPARANPVETPRIVFSASALFRTCFGKLELKVLVNPKTSPFGSSISCPNNIVLLDRFNWYLSVSRIASSMVKFF